MDPAPKPNAARIGQYANKAKRSRDFKRALSAPADEEAPSTRQKSKQNAFGKIKAKLGEEEFLRIRDQYTAAQKILTAAGDGVIAGVLACKTLSSLEVRTIFNIGWNRIQRLYAQNDTQEEYTSHYTEAEIEAAQEYILSWPSEVGFSCSHTGNVSGCKK